MTGEKTIQAKELANQKRGNTSWKPARVLDIPAHLKDPRFTYRWASKDATGRVQKLLSEGWEIDKTLSKKLGDALPATTNDGAQKDSTLQMRELIVMRIPKDLAKARNDYYASKTDDRTKGASHDLDNSGQGYGKINRSH